jgi:hypothetical protein
MNLPPFICPVLYGLEQAYFLSAQGIKLHIKLKVLTVTRSIINDYIQDTLSGCSRLSLLHGRFLVNVQITISGRCCYTRVVYSILYKPLRRNYRNYTEQPSECVASFTLSQRHPMWGSQVVSITCAGSTKGTVQGQAQLCMSGIAQAQDGARAWLPCSEVHRGSLATEWGCCRKLIGGAY